MRTILFSFMLAITTTANAQSVGEMFVNIPDSLFSYLSKEQRNELVNLKKMDASTPAVLRSPLNCDVNLSDIETERLTINIDSTVTMEMARLATDGGDSLYCMLRTVATPEKETAAYIYNKAWRKIADVDFSNVQLLHRPDTMSEDTFTELNKLIEFRMVEARFENSTTIILQQNVPMVSQEDEKRLDAILVQRKLKWNGKIYKID